MKLQEYMNAVIQSMNVSATGERIGRQMVLAVDCSEEGSGEDVKQFAVVAFHIETHDASLTASTTDKKYIAEGNSTLRTGVQRVFHPTGQLLRGDEFHDFVTSHKIKYGVGSEVQRAYVYFDPGTKKGEKGVVTISVNKDGASAADDPNDLDVTMSAMGIPEEYTYEEV